MNTRTFNELTKNHTVNNEKRKIMKQSIIRLGIFFLTVGLLSGGLSLSASAQVLNQYYADRNHRIDPTKSPELIKRIHWHANSFQVGVSIEAASLPSILSPSHWTWIIVKPDKNYPDYFWGRKYTYKNGFTIKEDVHIKRFNSYTGPIINDPFTTASKAYVTYGVQLKYGNGNFTDAGYTKVYMELDYREECIGKINSFRATKGLEPLQRWYEKESCADSEAKTDSIMNKAHYAFLSCGESAQNECPGYASIDDVLGESGLDYMYNEGPGGGHYENMMSSIYTKVACGIYRTPNGKYWAVQNFYK